jgi:DNA-binding GntR family transcriptional regulator
MTRSNPDDTSKKRIYTKLRRSIILGHRQPGERLNVDALARSYGTSVTPVRDALQMLNQESLVTIRPRSGYFVTSLTLKQLSDLLEMREILEVAAIERAITRITDEQIEQLEHVHAGYSGEDDESSDRYASENRRFHNLVAEASGNQELAESVGRLHDRLARFIVLIAAGETQEGKHARIIEALRSRDVAVARQAMLDEVIESREIIMERLIQEEGAFWHLSS